MPKKKVQEQRLVIKPPRFNTLAIEIEGTAPYMQCRFSAKAIELMKEKMQAGGTARSKKERKARDFDEDYYYAQHISDDGWNGIPAAAFRNACIDACRMAGFKMTHAKMSVFVEADGYDQVEGAPLVQINGKMERTEGAVRVQQTTDIRVRPMWRKWGTTLRIRYDEDQFTAQDVVNLLARAGKQVGIGEGRPFSKSSNGMGYGLFKIKDVANV